MTFGNWRTAAAAATVFSAVGGAPALAQDSCANPQAQCGQIMDQECLARVGAGVLAVGDADDCSTQLEQYRECLAAVIEQCPDTRQVAPAQDPGSLEALASSLGRLGGLIEAPETAVEFYNNALVYARRGDALSSRRMYEKAIVAGVDAVDVHQRYSQLLRAQEGLIGAREIYADLVRRMPDNRGAQLANALLRPAPEREDALKALVDGDDPFAPTYYELAALVSADRLGSQSIEDKRAEKAALEAFDAADQAGRVYRWFLQKETVEIWRESARRRLAAYQTQSLDVAPVQLTATPSNDSWTVTFMVLETARTLRYRIDGGPIKDTGHLEIIDARTGQPSPRPFIQLPLGTEQASIEVWYDDIREIERGPFELSFNAQDSFTAMAKNVLGNLTTGWIQDRDFDDRHLIYFTHLMSYRCGLAEIAYGLDRETPDQVWPLAPCDPKNPYATPADAQIYLDFNDRIGFAVVQLTYADGSTSELRRFDF